MVTDIDSARDALIDMGVTEQTLQIVTAINGYTVDTMLDVLYVHTGYRDFAQAGC